jgi:hypothetical protein
VSAARACPSFASTSFAVQPVEREAPASLRTVPSRTGILTTVYRSNKAAISARMITLKAKAVEPHLLHDPASRPSWPESQLAVKIESVVVIAASDFFNKIRRLDPFTRLSGNGCYLRIGAGGRSMTSKAIEGKLYAPPPTALCESSSGEPQPFQVTIMRCRI